MSEQIHENKKFSLSVWKKLLPYVRMHKNKMFMILAMNFILAGIDIMIPLFQRHVVANFIEKKTTDGLAAFIVLYAIVIVAQFVICFFMLQGCMSVDVDLSRDLKRDCFIKLQTLSLSYYNTNPVGRLLSRVMSDTERIGQVMAWNISDMLWLVTYIIGVFIAMFFLQPRLALLVVVIVPVIALLTFFFQKRVLHWNREMRHINSEMTAVYNEGITGVKTSKTLVIEEKNNHGFRDVSTQMYIASVKSARLHALFGPIVLFAGTIAVSIVVVRGGNLVVENAMEIATFTALVTYAVGIFGPIQHLARQLANFISVQANVERVSLLLEEVPGITDSPEVIEKYGDSFHPIKKNWESLQGEIVFDDVSFQYPDGNEEVLSHFSLTIPAGTTIAIVGETGAGKSTLVNLACRFFEPTGGRILIDGRDYKERSQLWLHSNIGYVLQNPHLFSGTIMENIRYGRLDATDDEVKTAAIAVRADDAIQKLEKGYENDVGEGGDHLSTGEKQLVSFARAVLADSRIFVLDEATSSIDTHTEQLIQEATTRLLKGRTSFVIAHRLSTIRQADLILVVKDGKIIEQGSHIELLEKKAHYYDLYGKQFQEEASVE